MRLFLAIDLPRKVKKELNGQLAELKKEHADFNWVLPENFHITLHFFGESDQVDRIKKKIDEAIYDAYSFHLYSLKAGLFLNRKIVLYISFRREKIVEKLVLKLRKAFQLKDEERFMPHLTFARYRVPSKQQYLYLKKKLSHLPIEIAFPVKTVYLFQSILEGKRPTYKKVATFPLLKPRQF